MLGHNPVDGKRVLRGGGTVQILIFLKSPWLVCGGWTERVESKGGEITWEAGAIVLWVGKGGKAFLPLCAALKVQ